ncbi:MAG: pre-peptidase C-terminal domain-containing protein, partial [Sedimenticola sp.]
ISGEQAARDPMGNLLDGDPSTPLPSGDGTPGDDYVVNFSVDLDDRVFPVLEATDPFGSLVYRGGVSGYAHSGDADSFNLVLEAGQLLNIKLDSDAALQGRVSLFDPTGTLLNSVDATTAGETLFLLDSAVEAAGAYRIEIESIDGGGNYKVGLLLNTLMEQETTTGTANDDLASAEPLDAAQGIMPIGAGERGAVSGWLNDGVDRVMLGTIGQGNTSSTLVEIDPDSGEIVRTIGDVGYTINGLEYVAATQTLYGTVSNHDANTPNHLVEIDLETGAGTPIGTGAGVGTINNLTSDSAGQLFAWAKNSSSLVLLDPVDGSGSLIGGSGINSGRYSLAFDNDNNLFFVDGNVYGIDPVTGQTNHLFNTDSAHHGDFDPLSNRFYGLSNTSSTPGLVVIDMDAQSVVGSSVTVQDAVHTLTFAIIEDPQVVADGEDWYHFSLAEGEAATLALEGADEGRVPLQLELYDAAGQLLTQGVSEGSSVDHVVDGFVADAAGTFYVRVSSVGDAEYNLLLTRNAGFDLDAGEATQVLSPSGQVLGAVDAGDGILDVAVLRSGNNTSAEALAQLNDSTVFDFNAVSVTVDQVDTLEELSAYDAVVLGDYSMWNDIGQMAPALRTWAEVGGGVVTTGYGLYSTNYYTSGQNQIDLDAVIPVQGVGGTSGTQGTLNIQNTGHPVMAGLSDFNMPYSIYASNGIDAGATVLGVVGSAETVVVADVGSGRTVYLGASYADIIGYSELRSGANDQLFEQAVAWAASGSIDRVDQYLIEVEEGDSLRITTAVPGGAAGEFVNTLDPVLTLYAADGSQVATDDNSLDGHDALITYTVPTEGGGQYRVEVRGAREGDDAGEYLLNIEGATGTAAPFEVVGSDIANGAGLLDYPDTYRIDLSAPVLQSSVDAGDLTINGVAADSVTVIDVDTLVFTIAGAATGDGLYTVEMATGALTSIGNQLIRGGSATFTVDATAPTVIASSLSEGDVLGTGDLQVAIQLSEELVAEVLGSEDLVLIDGDLNTYIAENFIYDPSTSVLSATFAGLKDNSYTLTLVSGEEAARDSIGNLLDGDPAFPLPSGDGIAGDDFVVNFSVDTETQVFPALTAAEPSGSLIYWGGVSGYAHAGDVDGFSLTLESGQLLQLQLDTDSTLQGRLSLLDSDGNLLNSVDATAAGEPLFLLDSAIEAAGVYRIEIESLNGGGNYRVDLLLNSLVEQESLTGAANDGLASAEHLDAPEGIMPIGAGERGAVTGFLNDGIDRLLLGTVGKGGTPSTLVEIDPDTGEIVRTIGDVGYSINGLEYVAATGTLYGTVSQNDNNAPSHLVEIDLTTGAGSLIGTGAGVGTISNLTSDTSGQLFAWTNSNQDLVRVDATDGSGIIVGPSGTGFSQYSLAFDGNDDLYLLAGNAYGVDPATGSIDYLFNTQQAHHGDFDPISGLFYGLSDTSSSPELVVIDMDAQSVVSSTVTVQDTVHTLTFAVTQDPLVVADGEDWYQFSLTEGESATLALEPVDEGYNSLQLELYDATGQLLTQGVNEGSSTDSVVNGFVAGTTGEFYVRISGDGDMGYRLLLTRNAAFDLEIRETQVLSTVGRVLGAVSGQGDGIVDVAVLRGSNNNSTEALAQLNDDTWFDFNAVSVTVDQIDTVEELDAYDVVVLGDYSMYYDIGQMVPALHAWAEAGGGVVTTGEGLRSLNSYTSGQNQIDLDAVIPVHATGGYGGISGTLNIQSTEHAVTAGLSDFNAPYSRYATNGIDAGATVLGVIGTAETVVVADVGSGHTVFLGARYAGSTSYSELRSGANDQLFEQAVAWAATGGIDGADDYQFEAQAGDSLRITSNIPGGADGEFINTLDPVLTLYAPDGSEVATDDNSLDGHDALITYTVPTEGGGQYRVEVRGAREGEDAGEYLLNIEGATGAAAPFEVVGSNIADGAGLLEYPDTYRIDLSAPVLQTSVDAADLTINGVAADSVTIIDVDTLEFSIASVVTGDGIYTVEMAAGALTSIGNRLIEATSATFTADATAPTVIASTLSEGDVLGAGDLLVEIEFSETLAADLLGSEDLVLVDSDQDTYTADSFVYDSDSSVLSVGFTGLKDGSYTLILASGEQAARDPIGNLLDGAPSTSLPSGDGTPGDDYVVNFSVDLDDQIFPALEAVDPFGSLIYQGGVSGYASAGDVDDFSLILEPGQLLHIKLDTDAGLQGRVSLFDPTGTLLNSVDATTAGEPLFLLDSAVETAGAYRIEIESIGGSGNYNVG